MMTQPINLGILLCDQSPEIFNLLEGYDAAGRSLELIRLGSVAPDNCSGYVTQIERGTRAVRLDAAQQLQRAGVEFNCDIPRSYAAQS